MSRDFQPRDKVIGLPAAGTKTGKRIAVLAVRMAQVNMIFPIDTPSANIMSVFFPDAIKSVHKE